ncbi:MAG: RAMP superfamily CRISPR-associated protein [Aigarchaeota archaeon]|nr:RAMP superfamily CRISPR-associated protein [Candidatus Geocrenenecus dongiae]
MSLVRVQVVKNPPRDRSILQYISGRIGISLTALSYLHIGSGDRMILETEETTIRETVNRIRDIREVIRNIKFKESSQFHLTSRGVTIPGSSVKGNVRARLELTFRNVGGKVKSCFQKSRILRAEPAIGEHGWRHYRIWGEVLREDRGPPCDYTTNKSVCLICDLFGTTGLKGVLEFSDFISSGNVSLETLKLPYGMELVAVKQNSRFEGFIDFYNLKPEEIGLVLIGLGLRDKITGNPVLMGRLKYRGNIDGREFGKIRYEVNSLELFKYSKPLKLYDIEIDGGQKISEGELDKIIKLLTDNAFKSFEGLNIVDEVGRLGELK